MNEFKYIENNSVNEEGVVTMNVFGSIGYSVDEYGILSGVDGNQFANEMQWAEQFAKRIDIRINSYGGSILDGLCIIDAILNSKVPVNTSVVGMAFSMAGVIAACGANRTIVDFGKIMVHNPSGGNKKVLEVMKDTLVTIFQNNSKITSQKIIDLMNDETFLNPKEAKALGLVDEVIKTQRKVQIEETDIKKMYNAYNSAINPKPKSMKKIQNKLGLDENTNEDVAVNAISELENKIKALKEANDTLTSKLKAIEDADKIAKEKEVTEMINSFVNNGTIKEDEKESMIAFANIDFNKAKNMLDRMSEKAIVPAVKLTDSVKINPDDNKSNWDYERYEKEAPQDLIKMYEETPDIYNRLLNASLKKNKVNNN